MALSSNAGDVITSALKEIGVLAAGETATAADSSDGLTALNRLVDALAAERLAIYTETRTTWTIVADDGQYSVGSGGDVAIARPVFIRHVGFIDTSTDPDTEYPLHKLTENEWAGITQKALTSTFPTDWYYNPTYTTGTLDLWPVPTSSDLEGVIYAPQAVSQFDALTTSVSLPPGYEDMLVLNLALRLAPSYGAQVHPELKERAREAIAVVKRANKRLVDLSVEEAALVGYRTHSNWDITTGP